MSEPYPTSNTPPPQTEHAAAATVRIPDFCAHLPQAWFFCRRLNAVTVPDRYPLSNMQSLNDRMAGCTVIFFENRLAIAKPFGLWEFLFMAFGLRSAAQALHWLKYNILMGLEYVFSFLDDRV
jgi:hypothetical protein